MPSPCGVRVIPVLISTCILSALLVRQYFVHSMAAEYKNDRTYYREMLVKFESQSLMFEILASVVTCLFVMFVYIRYEMMTSQKSTSDVPRCLVTLCLWSGWSGAIGYNVAANSGMALKCPAIHFFSSCIFHSCIATYMFLHELISEYDPPTTCSRYMIRLRTLITFVVIHCNVAIATIYFFAYISRDCHTWYTQHETIFASMQWTVYISVALFIATFHEQFKTIKIQEHRSNSEKDDFTEEMKV